MDHLGKIIFLCLGCLFLAIPAKSETAVNTDSIAFYSDRVKRSPSNKIKKEWIEKALSYSLREHDTLALYRFRLEKAYLSFSYGNYLNSFDSLQALEKAVSAHMGRISLLQNISDTRHRQSDGAHISPYTVRNLSDSLWGNLHVDICIALVEVEIYLVEFTEALELVGTLRTVYSRDSNDQISGRCYNALGAIFAHKNMIEQARNYFYKALDICERKNDLEKSATIYANLSPIHSMLKEPELALKCATKSYLILDELGIKGEHYIYAAFYTGIAYKNMQQYALAEEYLLRTLKEAEEKEFSHLALYIRSNLITLYLEMGQNHQAEIYAQTNLQVARESGNQAAEEFALLYLAEIYERDGNYTRSLEYLGKAYFMAKAMAESDQELRMGYLQRKFENYRQEQERIQSVQALELADSKLKIRNFQIGIVFAIGLLLAGLVFMIYRRLRASHRLNQIMQKRLDETESFSLNRLELLQKNMQRTLTDKDKELASMALYHMKVQSLVEILGEKLRAMRIMSNLKGKEKMYLSEMESVLRDFTPGKNWHEFELYFRQTDVEFFDKLNKRFPGLSPNDKRLCALLHLNLSTKEIASMTARTVNSVNTAKTRLKQKLGCDANQSIYDFLTSL